MIFCNWRCTLYRNMTSFSPILCSANESRYLFCAFHHARIVGWLPCLKHLLSFEEQDLSFRLAALWSSSTILLHDNAKNSCKSLFAFSFAVGLRLYFKFLQQLKQMIPISEKALQSGRCFFQNSLKVRRSQKRLPACRGCEGWFATNLKEVQEVRQEVREVNDEEKGEINVEGEPHNHERMSMTMK